MEEFSTKRSWRFCDYLGIGAFGRSVVLGSRCVDGLGAQPGSFADDHSIFEVDAMCLGLK